MGQYLPSERAKWAEGQPISELMSRALANPHLISLAAGFVDQATLPVAATSAAVDAVFASPLSAGAALQYGTTPGFAPLREAILKHAARCDGVKSLALEQVVITAGSNQLLHLVGECLLNVGDIVLCASPTYLVFLGTLNNLGARSYGVAADSSGIIPAALEGALLRLEQAGELPRVKAIYVVPYFDNPGGVTMTEERRRRVVEIAEQYSKHGMIHIIEDAAYRELRYAGDDIRSTRVHDASGRRVIVAGTFSKSFSPGIRIGWGILPMHLIDPLCNQKGNIDFGSPNFSQHVMAEVLQQGLFEPHVALLRQSYRLKMEAMLQAADEFLAPLPGVHWLAPRGGLYVWLKLPPHIDAGPAGKLFDAAIAEGVLYVPGQYCYPSEGEPVQRNTIRLSFGVQTSEKIREGVAMLARAIQRMAQA